MKSEAKQMNIYLVMVLPIKQGLRTITWLESLQLATEGFLATFLSIVPTESDSLSRTDV
jgi:hypothetical protein